MALVGVTQASKITGKSRATIYRKMKKGDLSYATDGETEALIDTSELIRVFGPLVVSPDAPLKQPNDASCDSIETVGFSEFAALETQLTETQKRLEVMEQLLQAKESHIQDLRQAMLLLEHKQSAPVAPDTTDAPKKKGLFKRLFG